MSDSVYFIAAETGIKIGKSANVAARISTLRIANASPLTLIGSVEGGHDLERAVHHKLKPHRLRGEWFRDCEEVRAVIDDVLKRGAAAVREFYRTKPERLVSNHEPLERRESLKHPIEVLTSVIETCAAGIGARRMAMASPEETKRLRLQALALTEQAKTLIDRAIEAACDAANTEKVKREIDLATHAACLLQVEICGSPMTATELSNSVRASGN